MNQEPTVALPPSPNEVCQQTVLAWAQEQKLHMDLSEPTTQMAKRVNSWVSPQSVITGVQDIMLSHYHPEMRQVSREAVTQLGTRLAHALSDARLLASVQPRRPGPLG